MYTNELLNKRKSNLNLVVFCLCVIVIFFALSGNLWSLDRLNSIDNYLIDTWGINEGMPAVNVQTMAQTPDGYLWIATSKGLVRFDGIKFLIVPFFKSQKNAKRITDIPDALFVDREGVLWIGSEHGLTTYDFRTGDFNTFTAMDGLIKDRIRGFFQDSSGNLWSHSVASYVNCYADGKFRIFDSSKGLLGNKINSIAELPNGNLLFASRYNGIFLYKDETFSPLRLPCLGNSQIISLALDRFGDIWVGTNKGLFRFQGVDGEVKCTKFSKADGLSDDSVTKLHRDRHHRLWIGTLYGLNLLVTNSQNDVTFEYILPTNKIISLLEGKEGEMWIGSYSSGLLRLKNSTFNDFSLQEAYPGEIFFSLFEDLENNIVIGTASGKLIKFQRDKPLDVIDYPELSGTNITAIGEDQIGNIWIGTNGLGIYQLSPEGLIAPDIQGKLGDNVITTIYRDRKNNMWFGTMEGASVRRSSTSVIESLGTVDQLASKKVHAIFEDARQNIWIMTDRGVTFLEEGKTTPENVKHYLGELSVACIREDKFVDNEANSIYWVATRGAGLLRVTLTSGDPEVISFTVSQGMVTNTIFRFLEDEHGFFWMMSDSGILRVSKNDLNSFANKGIESIHCISYGEPDGIKGLDVPEFSWHMALKSSDNIFWFITRNGLYQMNPANIMSSELAPSVIIESVLREKKEVPLHRAFHENLFQGTSHWEFHFTSPSLVSPEKVKFKFRLVGFQDKWQYRAYGSPRFAYYKNLKPGDYKFEVMACNAAGNWSPKPASFSFTVEDFFTKTTTFKVLVILLIIGLIGTSIYLYFQSKKKPEEKRPPAYHGSQPLHPAFARECLKKLDHQMKVEKIYTDTELSLKKLAESIKVSNHQLSRLLNDNLNINFAEYINTHRIDETKAILADPKRSKEKITNIALDVGFNTMPAFYNAFKKNTGMTPSEYKKAMKKKK